MEPDDFNAAAHAFAATAVPGEWTVTEMTDALGTAHTLLTTTWLAPAKPLVPSSSSARSRGPAERRDEVEDGGDEWDVSSDDDARAPLPRPPVAGSGTAAHECRVRLCVSWSPTFRVPTACFTAEDAVDGALRCQRGGVAAVLPVAQRRWRRRGRARHADRARAPLPGHVPDPSLRCAHAHERDAARTELFSSRFQTGAAPRRSNSFRGRLRGLDAACGPSRTVA
jgi:hypothetical protein